MNSSTPTTKDVAYLLDHPEKAEKFDAQFGEGKAAQYLQAHSSAERPQEALEGHRTSEPAAISNTSPRAHTGSSQPTSKDMAYLRAHPDMSEKFDARFGEGTSASILQHASLEEPGDFGPLGELIRGNNPNAQDPEDTSILGEIAQGIGNGIQEALNETVDTLESFDIAASKKLDDWGIPSRLQIVNQEGRIDPDLKYFHESEGDEDWLGGKTTVKGDAVEVTTIKEPVTGLGRFTSSTTQFLAGMAGAGKVTGLKGLWGAFVNGAIADGVVFDPDDPNLTAWAEQNEYAVPFLTEALATDPEDPEWMNRMRNVTEGVILGSAIEFTLKGLKGLALAAKGKRVGGEAGEALIKQSEELVDEATQEARGAMEEGVALDAPDGPMLLTPETRVDTPKELPLADPDAIRAAMADKEMVTPEQISESLWFNASKMDGPMEAQAMIEVAGDALARSGALERLGLDKPESFDTVIASAKEELANLTGGSLDELTERVAAVGESAVEQGKFLVAGKMALQSLGREVSQVATKLDGMYALGKVDPVVEARLLDLMQTHTDLQGHLKRIQTAAARATSVGRIRTTDGIDAQAMDALTRVEAAGGSKAIRKAAKQLRMAGGPAQQAALLRDMTRGGRLNRGLKVVNEVFINNILSGWRTHAVNVTSNMVNTVVLPMERVMGGVVTRNPQQVREGFQQYVALRSAVMDSIRLSGRVLKNEMPVLDTQVKLDYQNEGFRAISKDTLGVESQLGGKIVDGMGALVRVPGRFLMAEDEFFKQIMFRSRLQARLTAEVQALPPEELKRMGYASAGEFIEGETRAATMTVQTLEGRWEDMLFKGRVVDDPEVKAQFIRDNLGAANEGSKYAADALRVAREATFTQPLKEGSFSHGWQQMANRHPVLRQITPFIQTPANILTKAFHRVPGVNMLHSQYRERLFSSDPNIKAEAAGEMATGVALSLAVLMLSYEGRITGGGPTDGKTRGLWMRDKKWQPYSINLGTPEEPHWVEYKRMDPYALPFGIAGDIAEMIQASENDPAFDSAGLFAMLVASVGRNLTSKTWLQGMADVIEVLHSSDRPQVAQRWMEQRVAAMVPFASANRTFNQDSDEFSREARGYLARIKANTPGMSDELPIRYDWVSGEAIENPTRLLGYITATSGPEDEVDEELRKLGYGFTGPDRKIGQIKLSSEQYQEWAKLMGTVKIGGKILKGRLKATMQTRRYDLDRSRIPDGVTTPSESHRVEMLRGIIAGYKQKARAALFERHPELYDAWIAYERYEADARSGKAQEGERGNLLLGF
ncbi:hypothetical protein [Aliiroseovarius crassostreae]|uniref:hypothetical protein n=1 Tax=Aliiroseovarius crassostreae TaxID=154981 RepID=UPI00220A0482|nr:hypothetical protein [Aliiroseovarius crassostreae]UWP89101.1 hypothetical protein K3J57_14840 [Aliiroseovarius crassostreae]